MFLRKNEIRMLECFFAYVLMTEMTIIAWSKTESFWLSFFTLCATRGFIMLIEWIQWKNTTEKEFNEMMKEVTKR